MSRIISRISREFFWSIHGSILRIDGIICMKSCYVDSEVDGISWKRVIGDSVKGIRDRSSTQLWYFSDESLHGKKKCTICITKSYFMKICISSLRAFRNYRILNGTYSYSKLPPNEFASIDWAILRFSSQRRTNPDDDIDSQAAMFPITPTRRRENPKIHPDLLVNSCNSYFLRSSSAINETFSGQYYTFSCRKLKIT